MMMVKEGKSPITWVGSRFSSKTFTTALALFWRMVGEPGLSITCVPGGKFEQGRVAMGYMKAFCRFFPRIRRRPWTSTTITLSNRSSFSILFPTENGVQGKRANVVWIDEAQLIDKEIFDLVIFQAGAEKTQVILTGTAEYPSVLHDAWEATSEENRMMTRWEEVVEAGITSREVVEAMREQVAPDAWRAMMECEWVKKGDRVFNPRIEKFDQVANPTGKWWGWDFNPAAGHWGVAVVKDVDGVAWVVEERVARDFREVGRISAGGVCVLEDGGTNSGYCDAVVSLFPTLNWRRERATAESRGKMVATALKMMGDNKVVVNESCVELVKNLPSIRFDDRGMPDKKSVKNPHVVDAFLLAIHASTSTPVLLPKRWRKK